MNNHLTKLLGGLLLCGALSAYATPPSQIPQTGQTTSYATGDDGALQKGTVGTNTAGRFVAGAQPGGAVCPSGKEVRIDNQTGLMWVQAPTSIVYTWANALIAPAIPDTYCGYTDWRLPTVNELASLLNQRQGIPAAWLKLQGFTNVQANDYWSSTSYAGYPSYAWSVNMYDGSVFNVDKAASHYVWPVRGGQ